MRGVGDRAQRPPAVFQWELGAVNLRMGGFDFDPIPQHRHRPTLEIAGRTGTGNWAGQKLKRTSRPMGVICLEFFLPLPLLDQEDLCSNVRQTVVNRSLHADDVAWACAELALVS